LLEPGSVIGVDGVLINTDTDTRMYTAETITDTEVWRIDKRPLIILISSYNQNEP
jgi:CRP-like cAMP-binding protein